MAAARVIFLVKFCFSPFSPAMVHGLFAAQWLLSALTALILCGMSNAWVAPPTPLQSPSPWLCDRMLAKPARRVRVAGLDVSRALSICFTHGPSFSRMAPHFLAGQKA